MKNPNGYGCVKHLSGSRRNPFAFVVTDHGKQIVKGYFPTKMDALAYQVEYWNMHGRTRLSEITLEELYAEWLPAHRPYVSESTVRSYQSAYGHLYPLYGMPIKEIKYKHMQAALDAMGGLSYASKKKVRNLLSLLWAYARQMDYTSNDYTGLLRIGKNRPVNPHHAISRRKVNALWKMTDVPGIDIILILIYTGLRNGELRALLKSDVNRRQKYIRIRKSKTAAGVRIIPIHSRIWPFVEVRLSCNGSHLIADDSGMPYTYSRLARLFTHVMKLVHGEKHKLHDTRHTCATWLDDAEVNDNAKKMILGHARNDVTNGVYTHKNLRQLRKTIEKI